MVGTWWDLGLGCGPSFPQLAGFIHCAGGGERYRAGSEGGRGQEGEGEGQGTKERDESMGSTSSDLEIEKSIAEQAYPGARWRGPRSPDAGIMATWGVSMLTPWPPQGAWPEDQWSADLQVLPWFHT